MSQTGHRPRANRLSSPLHIKSMELKNRTVMPPMTTLLAGPGGEITDRFLAF